jgi:hypothetical protein
MYKPESITITKDVLGTLILKVFWRSKMLANLNTNCADPGVAAILAVLSGRGEGPENTEPGIYVHCGFNFTNYLECGTFIAGWAIENLPGTEGGDYISTYGVCDTVEQWKEAYAALVNHPTRKFAVGFTEVRKADEPESGGWRWHKWGPYIGTKSPQCEYIAHEGPEIESVLTYSIVEIP